MLEPTSQMGELLSLAAGQCYRAGVSTNKQKSKTNLLELPRFWENASRTDFIVREMLQIDSYAKDAVLLSKILA